MTQEEKYLVIKDLCGRLPYGVKVKVFDKDILAYDSKDGFIKGKENMEDDDFIIKCRDDSWVISCEDFKPYLRPISSMTKEEKKEWIHLRGLVDKYIDGYHVVVDFYNRNYFDYRCLIEDEFAIEAPEGMYEISK